MKKIDMSGVFTLRPKRVVIPEAEHKERIRSGEVDLRHDDCPFTGRTCNPNCVAFRGYDSEGNPACIVVEAAALWLAQQTATKHKVDDIGDDIFVV